MKCGFIRGVHAVENITHSQEAQHCHQLERSWQWHFGIWREFCLWTTKTKSLGMHMLLAALVSEFKGGYQGKNYEER
jgi:hypothetical protein